MTEWAALSNLPGKPFDRLYEYKREKHWMDLKVDKD